MREEHRLLFGPASKDFFGRIRSGQSEVRRVIAKFRQSGESPERSSSLLVVVVCMEATRLPIQLSKDANTFLMTGLGPPLTTPPVRPTLNLCLCSTPSVVVAAPRWPAQKRVGSANQRLSLKFQNHTQKNRAIS
jgi:hypothetical protein